MNLIHLFFFTFIFLTNGCSNKYKNEVLKEELREEINITKLSKPQESAFKIIEVKAENFSIQNLSIPDREVIKRVKLFGAELNDVIALLTEATDEDVIFQLQSAALGLSGSSGGVNGGSASNSGGGSNGGGGSSGSNDEAQIRSSRVYLSAKNIGFGRLLHKSVGDKLSIRFADGTYYLGYVRTETVKIPPVKGLSQILQQEISTLGAVNVVLDRVTSTVTFSAREKEYLDIMRYLEIMRNNIYVIEYDIAIYNVTLKDEYSLGINWDLITGEGGVGFISKTASTIGLGATGTPAATFGTLFNAGSLKGSILVDALSYFGKVESIQKPKLLGLAGTDVTLVDALEEPYIKEISTTAVGNNGVQSSTVSAIARSGIKITLNSNIMDGTVISDITINIDDIVGYTSFEVDGLKFNQPKVLTKQIENSLRVKPGVPIIISGLFRHKTDKGFKGMPGLDQTALRLVGGTEYTGLTKSEMVIIVVPSVTKYVIK
ncbi:hypothetical protein JHD50_06340 [Sulfurimonas sp. MAG313]|nr:hypothetical protein [Sulfurimonas sp. MAG313]MDF1880926.1 hypothetical protein [Sulfurimonas sp. MAG313]